MKGWTSNRDLGNDKSIGNEGSSNGMKLLTNQTAEKVLGLAWDHRKDVFTFKVTVKSSKQEQIPRQRMTKREIVSEIAHIFDPLGFAAASSVKVKTGMQRLWQEGVD